MSDDVFCIFQSSKMTKPEVCILKSRAIQSFLKDGMSEEEAFEFFDFIIAGANGAGQYSIVDDMIDLEEIQEMVKEESVYDPREHDK